MADSIDKKVEEIIERLGQSRDIVQYFQDIARLTSLSAVDAKALQDALKGVAKSSKEVLGNFEDASKGIKSTAQAQKDLTKSLKTQQNLGIEINKQLKAQGFSQEEIKTILNGTADEREYLLKLAQNALDVDLGAITAAVDANKYQSENIAQAEENLKIAQNYNTALGATGGLIGGVGEGLKRLGFDFGIVNDALTEAKEKMIEVSEKVTDGGQKAATFGDKLKVMGSGLSSLGGNIASGLMDPLFLAEQFTSKLLEADDSAGKIAKNFGISYRQAAGLTDELNDAANASYLLNVTTQGQAEAFIEINNRYGTFAKLSEANLNTFQELKDTVQLSGEALGALYDISILTGKELEGLTSEFLGEAKALALQNDLALNEKEILESVKDISKATLLSLQAQPQALAKAVVQAKALGTTVEKVAQISNSLLQFEDSITSELEAELLIGKDITLERARQAALNGDIATVAEEIAKQIGDAGKFGKYNVLQQEALAKAVGMTREDLAASLLEREALADLAGVEGDSAKERFDNLVKEVGLEEAKKQLGDESLANMLASQNTQERFAAAMEKLQEVFASLAQPLLPVLDILSSMLNVLGPIVGAVSQFVKFLVDGIIPLKTLVGLLITFKGIQLGIAVAKETELALMARQMAMDKGMLTFAGLKKALEGETLALKIATYALAVKDMVLTKGKLLYEATLGKLLKSNLITSIGEAAMTAIKGLAGIPIVGWGLGLAAAGAVTALGYQFLKDGQIGPDGGLVVSGEKGTYKLDKNDTVIAGTELGTPMNNTGGGRMPTIDIGPLVTEMQNVRAVLQQILAKEGEVFIDSTKVGVALAVGTSKLK
jgi:predicted XRE-type DNA-binding protein